MSKDRVLHRDLRPGEQLVLVDDNNKQYGTVEFIEKSGRKAKLKVSCGHEFKYEHVTAAPKQQTL